MASMVALPRKGHLEALYHIFAYLQKHHNAELIFDPSAPDFDIEGLFPRRNWKHTPFCDAVEEIPTNCPDARGLGFTIFANVDSDHAGDEITRRSQTGFIVFLNNAPIYWFLKKQAGIETSSFGSEFIAMKQCCEYVRGLCYKLRMMGIPVDGPAFIYGDNKSVLANSSIPESVLKKKHCSVAYHYVREAIASMKMLLYWEKSDSNLADLFTKVLNVETRGKLIRGMLS